MTLALIILATLLGLAVAISGITKLRRVPAMVAVMQSVGVGASQMRGLAVLELLGAAGLFVGIWSKPIGVAAGVGLCLYFLGALVVHVRAKHSAKDLTPALIIFLLAVIVTILELAR